MTREPTEAEIDAIVHEASSVQVRARRRMLLLRVTRPPDVEDTAWRAALTARLQATPLGAVDLVTVEDPGEVRVLGAIFA